MKPTAFKQRLIGAIFILSLGVILIPVILEAPSEDFKTHFSAKPRNPGLPEIAEVSKISYVFNDVGRVVDVVHEEVVAVVNDPKPKPTALGDWTIQLGAFSSTENAKELLRRLSKEGFESYLKETPGGKLVRVFVAPGIDKTSAQHLLTKLDAEFGIKGIVVRYREE